MTIFTRLLAVESRLCPREWKETQLVMTRFIS
eukprot:SAG11_NODE_17733_length_510_cov_0.975669_1_plen_31_part_10